MADVTTATPRPLPWLREPLRAIVLWEDLVVSVVWLLIAVVTIYVTLLSETSVLVVLAYALLGAVLANLALVSGQNAVDAYMGRPFVNPNLRHLSRKLYTVDRAWAQQQGAALADALNDLIDTLRDVVFVKNVSTSLAVAALAWLSSLVFHLIAFKYLALVGVLALFSLPRAYLDNQARVDAWVAESHAEAQQQVAAKVRDALRNTPLKRFVET